MKLSWMQKVVLRALLASLDFEAWVRNRALRIPAEKRQAIADRLKVSNTAVEAVEFEIQNQALRALRELVGK